jgi:hypothetical protein
MIDGAGKWRLAGYLVAERFGALAGIGGVSVLRPRRYRESSGSVAKCATPLSST